MSTPLASPKTAYFNFGLFMLLAIVWSGSFINIKIVVDVLPPLFSAMMRVLISLVGLAILFTSMRKKLFLYSPKIGWLWLAGFFAQALPFGFLFYGEKFIAPALASIINSTVSFWALILGTLFFRDLSQWSFIKIMGLLSGFLGITLIFMPLIHKGDNNLIGILAIMGMAICYAIGGLINQHLIFRKMTVTFETNLFQQHVVSVIILALASFIWEPLPSFALLLDTKIICAFLYLGIVATALAWMIYFFLIREWGAVRASSVMYLVPLLAIVWDLLFLHLVPPRNELMGAGAILIGVILIQWVKKKPSLTVYAS